MLRKHIKCFSFDPPIDQPFNMRELLRGFFACVTIIIIIIITNITNTITHSSLKTCTQAVLFYLSSDLTTYITKYETKNLNSFTSSLPIYIVYLIVLEKVIVFPLTFFMKYNGYIASYI